MYIALNDCVISDFEVCYNLINTSLVVHINIYIYIYIYQAYQCLHHLHALGAHGVDELVDTESALFLHLLHHHIQEDEGASSANPCTAVHQQRLVQGSRVLLTDIADKVDKRHSIVWHSMIRPSCVLELMDYQVVFVRL